MVFNPSFLPISAYIRPFEKKTNSLLQVECFEQKGH